MSDRRVLIYYAWNRPAETGAPLAIIDDRFPALFELRRLRYPDYETLSDPSRIDQGIGGFLDHVQKQNFAAFVERTFVETGYAAAQVERVSDAGAHIALDDELIADVDTLVVIGFDSLVTRQSAAPREVEAVRRFLAVRDHFIAICPHHDIGACEGEASGARRLTEHLHHGDPAIPPRQGFGGFARTLLAGLGVPVQNRFGLRPATLPGGLPAPVEVDRLRDRLSLLRGVESLNLHPHLPQLERVGAALEVLDVLVRQPIDATAPAHPFTRDGRCTFDALLQSRPEAFAGTLWVCDATLWSSTAGGLGALQRLWCNVLGRPVR